MSMDIILYFFLIFIGLLLLQEIFRHFPRLTLMAFVVLPIFLIPFWINLNWAENYARDWFLWAKISSLLIGVIWLSILKLTNLGKYRFAKITAYFFLVINILEAVIRDAQGSNAAHYLNSMAGILLIATLEKIDSISITNDKYKDFVWRGMTLMWVVGYTIWNWTFVYLNFVSVSLYHIAVLGVPLAVAFINKNRWVQSRVFTLTAYFLFFYSLPKKTAQDLYVFWGNEAVGFFLAEASLIFMIIYTIIFLRSRGQKNKIK